MTSIGASSPDINKKDYSLGKIHEASRHLLGVVNDILDVSKIEANKFGLSESEFMLDEMFKRVVDVINFRIVQKQQKLTVYLDPNIPRVLVGDDQRLAQVIANLLSNAVKFTPENGAIHLEAVLMSIEDGVCTLKILVSDTGIGISKEQQDRLFTSFEQAEASTSRKYGGTGLGLVICKSIVEMMDGKIWVESELGKGAVFALSVRLFCGGDQQRKLLVPELKPSEIRVLVIDEDWETLDFFEESARSLGVELSAARSGREAISMVSDNNVFSICFVSWYLLGKQTIETAHAIHRINENIKIIFMMPEADWNVIQDSAGDAGVFNYIPKPLFLKSIADCINECLSMPEKKFDMNSDNVFDFSGHCILLVEDVEINREIVMTLLEPTNLSIDCATNGIEAVDAFVSAPLKYDMIFMDIQMPEMDGFTATKRIRESGAMRAREIPIVAMTANAFKEDIEKCLEAGMNDHIGKPLAVDKVISTLERILKQ